MMPRMNGSKFPRCSNLPERNSLSWFRTCFSQKHTSFILEQRDFIRTILVEICLLIIPLYLLNKAKCLNRLLRTKSRHSLFCHHGPRLSCLRDNVCRQFSQISTSHCECWWWHKTRVNMTEGCHTRRSRKIWRLPVMPADSVLLLSRIAIDHWALVYDWNLKYVFASLYSIFISLGGPRLDLYVRT